MLICIRSPHCVGEEENRFVGQQDSPLSESGRKEAELTSFALMGQIDHVFSSPLQRAHHLAFLISINMEKIPELTDRSGGIFEGVTYGELKHMLPPKRYKLWLRDWYTAPQHGESYQDVTDRVLPIYMTRIKPLLESGKRVLVVSHSCVIKILLGKLGQLSEKQIMESSVERRTPYVFRGPF